MFEHETGQWNRSACESFAVADAAGCVSDVIAPTFVSFSITGAH